MTQENIPADVEPLVAELLAPESCDSTFSDAVEPSEIDDIIGNAIDHCGYFMEGPVKQKVMLAARCVRVALTNAGLLASSPAPAVEPSEEAVEQARCVADSYWESVTSNAVRNVLRAAYAIDSIRPASDGWEPIESAPSDEAVDAFGSAFDPDFSQRHTRRVREGLRAAYAIDRQWRKPC